MLRPWITRIGGSSPLAPPRNTRTACVRGLVTTISSWMSSNAKPCMVLLGPMRHIQLANRRDIAVRVARKHGNAVADIVFDGVNVSVLRVDVNAAVELDVCVFA